MRAMGLLLLLAGTLAVLPADAAPCDVGVTVSCSADAGPCEAEAGANVVTTTAAGASASCGVGPTRCSAGHGVGQQILPPEEPSVDCGV